MVSASVGAATLGCSSSSSVMGMYWPAAGIGPGREEVSSVAEEKRDVFFFGGGAEAASGAFERVAGLVFEAGVMFGVALLVDAFFLGLRETESGLKAMGLPTSLTSCAGEASVLT